MDLDVLNDAMRRRAHALSRLAYWHKKVEEAELAVQAVINGTYTAPEPEQETEHDPEL